MKLRIAQSTDRKFMGDVVDLPHVTSLGTLTKKQIQAFAATIYEGQFIPDSIHYPSSGDRVRLTNSNYSVTFEVIDNG